MQDPRQYQSDLVNQMLKEIFGIVGAEAQAHGYTFAHEIVMQFLRQYLGTCVVNSLTGPAETAPSGISDAAKFALSFENYKELKREVEAAIGEGFRIGWKAYAPNSDPEMICQIHTVTDQHSSKISH